MMREVAELGVSATSEKILTRKSSGGHQARKRKKGGKMNMTATSTRGSGLGF
jgi:hypothetical protein